MLVFAIDDERRMLKLLHSAIEAAIPQAEVVDFSLGSEAIRALEAQGPRPDFLFSDIRMPGLDGLALAVRVKQLSPDTRIIFVTGYTQYAYDAYQLHVSGYIRKPVDAQRIREELEHIAPEALSPRDVLRVQCFGRFEVFWQGKPVVFGRKQSKELLAFLIDQEGTVCTAEEICAALWEDETDMRAMKTRIRQMVSDLKVTFAEIGLEDVLIRRRGLLGIRRDRVDCDYYRMLEGDMDAVNAFRGEYMTQYSWARMSEGRLYFRQMK